MCCRKRCDVARMRREDAIDATNARGLTCKDGGTETSKAEIRKSVVESVRTDSRCSMQQVRLSSTKNHHVPQKCQDSLSDPEQEWSAA